MNKRLFNQQNLTRRLRLLSVLCAMLLMPFSAWAVNYDIIVGGVQVTSDNAANITGGQISLSEDGKVSFDAENNVLTLNGATIDMSNVGQYPIESSLANLTIKLVGEYNTFTVNADKPYAVKGPGTGTLTFTTNENPKRCLLETNGVTSTAALGLGYTVSNTFETRTESMIGAGVEAEDGWKVRIFDKDPTYGDQVIIWNFKNYNLFIGDCRINSDNLASAHSGVLPYNPETHTLPIPYYLGYDVKSGLEELIIEVSDENTINASDYSKPAIRFEATTGGPTSGTLKFVKAADADLASITLTTDSEHKAIEGFAVDNIIITAPLQLKTPDSMSDILNATTVKIANYNEAYDIRIAGTTVTDANKDDVLGDGTVSYEYDTNTLLLNNATIIPDTEEWGITYSGTRELFAISLNGDNTVKGGGGCGAICYSGPGIGQDPTQVTPPELQFIKTYDAQPGSLTLNGISGYAEWNQRFRR